jgi:hypothetical protein
VKEVHGTHRVYLALDDVPGLAMSRSLGDYVAHSAGRDGCTSSGIKGTQ